MRKIRNTGDNDLGSRRGILEGPGGAIRIGGRTYKVSPSATRDELKPIAAAYMKDQMDWMDDTGGFADGALYIINELELDDEESREFIETINSVVMDIIRYLEEY